MRTCFSRKSTHCIDNDRDLNFTIKGKVLKVVLALTVFVVVCFVVLNSRLMEKAASTKLSVLFCTVPNKEVGLTISRALVKDKLVACVNIIPSITSVYEWEGKIEEDTEELLVIKTRTDLIADVTSRIKSMHKYDVPEIIAMELMDEGNTDYLDWVRKQTTKKN